MEKITVDIAPVMEALDKLRREMSEKMDSLSEKLGSFASREEHAEIEARVRALESFKAKAIGVVIACSAFAGAVGTAIGLVVRALK